MGCCASSPAPYDGQHNASSRNPIISEQPQSNAAIGRPSTAHSNPPQQPQPKKKRGHTENPGDKPDADLIRLVWSSKERTWTRRQIDQERDDFFFTRVTGHPEVWQTIKTALEVIWAGGDPADADGGWATAQAILRAASITVPNGYIHRGVFDQQGAKYDLPKHIICDPANLVVEDPVVVDDGSNDEIGDKSEGVSEEEEDEAAILQRREEKGKGVEVEQMQLKARRNDGVSHDLVISAGRQDTVKQILRKFSQSAGISPPKHLQLYYMGKRLDPELTLLDQGWVDGYMLSAFISDIQEQHSPGPCLHAPPK